MPEPAVTFRAQTAILDRFIQSSDPASDTDAMEVILEALRSRLDLRSYFFRNRPHPAWASVLWENGFFNPPPSPVKTENGYMMPFWDVQEYLIAVAPKVSDIVIKHVETIESDPWYIARAIQALRLIPLNKAECVVPRILEWLNDQSVAPNVAREAHELMMAFAKTGIGDPTFRLFQSLTAPVPSSRIKENQGGIYGAEAVSLFGQGEYDHRKAIKDIELLRGIDIEQVVTILERHLCQALKLEAEAHKYSDYEKISWWRTAIEESGQDLHKDYKDVLLGALRNTLEEWATQNPTDVEPLVGRYLKETREILRRLGLHLLRKFPLQFQQLVSKELLMAENLDDSGIHHEFFKLLESGFSHLAAEDQEALVAVICKGPSPEKVQKLADWAAQERGVDRDLYIRGYSRHWIRDRLWMIRDHLSGEPTQLLNELAKEHGEPDHPDFTRWSSGVYSVSDVSPLAEQQIAAMSPEDLIDFLKRWQPDLSLGLQPDQESWRGLANSVAEVILSEPQKYQDYLLEIALLRHEFADAFFTVWPNSEFQKESLWDLRIELCEKLLENDIQHKGESTNQRDWISARQSMVRLLETGLKKPEQRIPDGLLPRVRDILLVLVDDPDPDPDSDQPHENWAGHRDPATVAMNTVRPSALQTLILYGRKKAEQDMQSLPDDCQQGPGPERLEKHVQKTLTRKVSILEDQSLALHSVFGSNLCLLYWLDQKWVEDHLEHIFPEEQAEHAIWFRVAAWDSYVIFNHLLYQPLFEKLRPKYERAIDLLSMGYVTKTHLEPVRGLASHLLWEYLNNNYDLSTAEGQQSLLARFLIKLMPESRGTAVWLLWHTLEEQPDNREKYWPRTRALWEWRTHEAARANYPNDFDREMQWFVHLLSLAPKSETITSLWGLLEGLVHYVARSEHRDMLWDSLEEYLSVEVERDPVRAIRYYRLMHDQLTQLGWYHHREGRKIIETAASQKSSRNEALSLIDLIARLGSDQFRDIYEKYSG